MIVAIRFDRNSISDWLRPQALGARSDNLISSYQITGGQRSLGELALARSYLQSTEGVGGKTVNTEA